MGFIHRCFNLINKDRKWWFWVVPLESVIINIIPIELVLNNNIDLTYYKIKVQRISINKYPTIMLDLKYQRSKLQNISKTKKVKNKKNKKKTQNIVLVNYI